MSLVSSVETAPPRDRRSTRWDGHRRTRRSELVEATVRAIRRNGAGVGMDEIAAMAGTSKAALYRHFADKGELYLAVCARVADLLSDELRTAARQSPHPRQMLAASIDAYLRLIETDPEVYRFVVHRPALERPVVDPVTGLSALVGDTIARMLAARLRVDGLGVSAAGPWAHGLVGLVRAAADHWLAGPPAERISRTQLTTDLTEFVWGGLAGVLGAAAPPVSAEPVSASPATAAPTAPAPEDR